MQYCPEQFLQRRQRADRAVVFNFFYVSFFVYHFYPHFLPCIWCELVLLYDFVEDLSHHFSRLVIACFDVFCSDSVAVCRFAFFFLSLLIAVCSSSVVLSGILIVTLVLLLRASMLLSFSFSSISCSVSSCSLSSYSFFVQNSPKAIPFRDVTTSPFHSLSW